MPNTIVNQATGVSLQLTDYLLGWQSAQSPSTRKIPVSDLGTYYAALSGATFTGAVTVSAGGVSVTGNSTVTGTLTVSSSFIATGITVTSAGAQLSGVGGWSSSNVGKQLLVQATGATSNPAIGFTDSTGGNLWGLYNNSGVFTLASMPAYNNSSTAPTVVQTWSSGSTSVTGTLTTSSKITVSSGGVTVTAGGVTITGNSTLAGTLGGLTGLTVASGGASITGSSTINGTLTIGSGSASILGGASNTAISIHGTNTNDTAAGGYVGEFTSSNVAAGSAVSLTDSVAANVTSISLSAGDWFVYGNVGFTLSVSATVIQAWISTTSATAPTTPGSGGYSILAASGFLSGSLLPISGIRISLASTTTVYLGTFATFTGTGAAYGFIGARRAR